MKKRLRKKTAKIVAEWFTVTKVCKKSLRIERNGIVVYVPLKELM